MKRLPIIDLKSGPAIDPRTRWIPIHAASDEFDDCCITVEMIGRDPERFWAKADGLDPETGSTRYKLLPMERG